MIELDLEYKETLDTSCHMIINAYCKGESPILCKNYVASIFANLPKFLRFSVWLDKTGEFVIYESQGQLFCLDIDRGVTYYIYKDLHDLLIEHKITGMIKVKIQDIT